MSWFEHDGSVDWKCSDCGVEGTHPFKRLRTAGESPLVSDYDGLLPEVEIEHALTGCNGSLISGGGFRYRMVEHKDKPKNVSGRFIPEEQRKA